MFVTDAQVRKLMEEMNKHGKIGRASIMSGMDRSTARKYQSSGILPSQNKIERTWRTRENPFEEDWPTIEIMLEVAPALESKTIFDWLTEQHEGRYVPGQLRSLQRRIRDWRATNGPEKEVFFAQEHRPGEAMQTDFTHATALKITICGELLEHLLCHNVLPYSNWEWATVSRSESLMAIRRGIQSALIQLGRVPKNSQTDNSTAATHKVGEGKRGFNEDYERFVEHFGMEPRTIAIGKCHQNGDVESLNNVLKKRLEQYLLLRGSRDFESVAAYESWVQNILRKTNGVREVKIREELAVMKELVVSRLPEYMEKTVKVSRESTIRIKNNSYSVPSRLRDHKVKVRIYDDRLEVYYGTICQLVVERLLGEKRSCINYRHVIWSLVKKPGAFARYRYREEMFPSMTFRLAYDALCDALGAGYAADVEYLRILHQAAAQSESDVEIALEILLESGSLPLAVKVKELVQPGKPEVPEMAPFRADLTEYDTLLQQTGEA